MTEPSLALQRAIWSRLIGNSTVTDLVAPANIKDGATRPTAFPSIILGDGQVVAEGDQYSSWLNATVYLDIHLWALEAGLETVKEIAGAVVAAIGTSIDVPDFLLSDGIRFLGARYMRDPSGKNSHAVVSFSCFMGWRL